MPTEDTRQRIKVPKKVLEMADTCRAQYMDAYRKGIPSRTAVISLALEVYSHVLGGILKRNKQQEEGRSGDQD